MKNLLKDLIDAKLTLAFKQREFQKFLFSNFPCLMQKDCKDLIDRLNSELEVALSFCLRKKSARIDIPTKRTWRGEGVVHLTYDPGLKCNYSRNSDVELLDSDQILKDKNLIYEEKKETKLSVLFGHPDIVQEKLLKFYDFLEKAIEWLEKIKKFYNSSYSNDSKSSKEILFKNFKITFLNNSAVRIDSTKENSDINYQDLDELYEYQRGYDEVLYKKEEKDKDGIITMVGDLSRDQISNTLLLDLILNESDELVKELKNLEKEKSDLVIKSENLLKKIRTFTIPFRVMKKLDKVN